MEIRAIIIEDEKPATELLLHYLKTFSNIIICGTFSDGFSGLKAINELKPQLVFLDIQMPKLTGIEILELLDHKPAIIFTTAYDQYAVKAFEANAIDYLLKPFSSDRFTTAVNKAVEKIYQNQNSQQAISSVITALEPHQTKMERIAVRAGSKIQVIPVEDILYFEADGDYVKMHTKSGNYLKEKTMKYLENHLDSSKFIRIHRTYIANVDTIQRVEYYDKENHVAVLSNNEKLKISSSGYKLLKSAINL
ncbi:MAG: LytTR family transcriptional regulator DNA-binding domain-containing protein [Bacteroidia bacterium]|nr:LytTR family transcriptional regulator DNA-binding domain-containing protein [Bacteroidia bacterium]